MSTFQKCMLALTGVAVLVLCLLAALVLTERFQPTREEQLAAACQHNPVDCERMRLVNAQVEAAIRQGEKYGPGMASSIAEIRQVQREYEDRFIAEGYYGDAREGSGKQALGNSSTVELAPSN